MKKNDLVKQLIRNGAKLVREGKGHEVWQSASGYVFTVPRHNEINEIVAKKILQQSAK